MTYSRATIIAGNWKMNYGPQQASSFAAEILPGLNQIMREHTDIVSVLCPPAISISAVHAVLETIPMARVELGAQNMYFEEKGAFTGEIAPGMVKEYCTNVILGHSERRIYFNETDELVNKKAQAAFLYNLRPIVCVGENEQEYDSGKTQEVIQRQIEHSLAHLTQHQASRVVIAYEPIWAIGTGKAATAEIASEVCQFIRHIYHNLYGDHAASHVHILYGGSVTTENIKDLISHPDIDGALVGGASLKVSFVDLVRQGSKVLKQ